MAYDEDYLAGIRHFNKQDFFEAHESWEDIWKRTTDDSRLFYKGLIHAAVALHHYGNGNIVGARKVIESCLKYLGPYGPKYGGLDLATFIERLNTCFQSLISRDATPQPLDETQIPKLCLEGQTV